MDASLGDTRSVSVSGDRSVPHEFFAIERKKESGKSLTGRSPTCLGTYITAQRDGEG